MMKVALRLNSVLRDATVPDDGSVARLAATASLAGVDSLVVVLPESNPSAWLKPLTLVKTVFDGPLAVACTGSSDHLDLINKLRPDLVIVTSQGFVPLIADDLLNPGVKSFCESMRTSRVSYGLHVGVSVADIKGSRQLSPDIVVLPVSSVIAAQDSTDAITSLEMLETAVIAADKLGMRVLLEGELDRSSWAAFSDLGLVEGVVLGKPIVERAILLGLHAAVAELKSMS